jgi:hypothetical protein
VPNRPTAARQWGPEHFWPACSSGRVTATELDSLYDAIDDVAGTPSIPVDAIATYGNTTIDTLSPGRLVACAGFSQPEALVGLRKREAIKGQASPGLPPRFGQVEEEAIGPLSAVTGEMRAPPYRSAPAPL